MIMRISCLKRYFYYVLIFFIMISANILSQDNTNNRMLVKDNTSPEDLNRIIKQNAGHFSSDLKMKLNLTESQRKYINNILVVFYSKESGIQTNQTAALRESNKSDKNKIAQDETITKIASIFDNEQENKWIGVKNSWWRNVNAVVVNGNGTIEQSDEIYEEKREYEDSKDYENYDVYSPGYDIK